MKRKGRPIPIIFLMAALLFGPAPRSKAAEQTPRRVEAKTITLGIVSETHQAEVAEHFRDFVRYVARKLSSGSEIEGRVIVAPAMLPLARLLEQRQVDFYMESPYPTYVINDVQGAATLLLRRWKRGMAEYRSLVFAKRDSPIKRLEDLRGKTIAFEDPGSSSGYFLPKFFLLRNGFKFSEKSQAEPQESTGQIGYVFAYSRENIVDWVLANKVAAGAFSDDDYARLEEEKRSKITVLAYTDTLPRHLVSVRKDLDSALVGRLEKVLLSMHEDEEGRKVLQKTDDTTKFDILPGGEGMVRRLLLETFYSPEKP